MKYSDAFLKLPQKFEHEVKGLTTKQLNTLPNDDDLDDYDQSRRFREMVLQHGYKIEKLFAVYYSGWECDMWSCIAKKGKKRFKL